MKENENENNEKPEKPCCLRFHQWWDTTFLAMELETRVRNICLTKLLILEIEYFNLYSAYWSHSRLFQNLRVFKNPNFYDHKQQVNVASQNLAHLDTSLRQSVTLPRHHLKSSLLLQPKNVTHLVYAFSARYICFSIDHLRTASVILSWKKISCWIDAFSKWWEHLHRCGGVTLTRYYF